MNTYLNSVKSHCVAEIESPRAGPWWSSVRQRQPNLRRFHSIDALRRFFEERSSCREHLTSRDRALRALVAEVRRDQPSPAFELLFVLYVPLFARTVSQLSNSPWRVALEHEEMESEVVHAFLRLLATLNLETNRDVHTSLCRRLRGLCVEWARRESQARAPLEALEAAPPQPRRSGWELDVAEHVLDELLDRRVIARQTHHLLVNTVVRRVALKDLAREPANSNGVALSYEAAKKCRRRGVERIRTYVASNNFTLVELAISSLEKISNSNVPFSEKAGSSRERSTRENDQGTNHQDRSP